MKAILYNRFSPRRIREGDSETLANNEDLESMRIQIETNTRHCEFHGLEVGEILKDPFVSARTPLFQRPEGSKLEHLPRGSVIVAMNLTRIFRNTIDGLLCLEYFKERRIALMLSDQGGNTLDVSTADGYLMATFMLGVASHEPMKTAERTSKGMRWRQSNHQRMTAASRLPYGQRLDPCNPSRTMPHADELAAIARIQDMHAQGLKPPTIAKLLNVEGCNCRGHKWSRLAVSRILSRSKSQESKP